LIINPIPNKSKTEDAFHTFSVFLSFFFASLKIIFVNLDVAAKTIVNALYIPRQLGVNYSYENLMLVGRFGYDENKVD
jgi:hypothetical protein